MSQEKRGWIARLPLLPPLLAAAAALVALPLLAACTATQQAAPLRALQASGPTSFLCLAGPADDRVTLPLSVCTSSRTDQPDDYSIPHLYALVTQLQRGEVAVIDLTTETRAVLDQDPRVPGATFLPVGSQPTDILSTPGSTATFVASAAPGREAIFALPSQSVRGDGSQLSSWPACALPAAPEKLELGLDPADATGAIRPSCDAPFGDDPPSAGCPSDSPKCRGDLSEDAKAVGRSGRYKLFVTLPSEGGVAVIDAQGILDREPGSFERCPIDRWLPLESAAPPVPPTPPAPGDGSCVPPKTAADQPVLPATSVPAGIALQDGTLYVADRRAPVIHRLQMDAPCEPAVLPPLLPTSAEDPSRIVTTSRVAVGPQTLDFERYLYAIDDHDGSVIVFDVSDGSANVRPLERNTPADDPFQPVDRIRFVSPPREVIIVQHQNDEAVAGGGSTLPVKCDPGPNASTEAASYRTNDAYDEGARPTRLRGVFGFILLMSGDLVTIDIDDFDANCRGPRAPEASLGCDDIPPDPPAGASNEFSCRTVEAHRPRSAGFLINDDEIARNQPGIGAFPVLFDDEGTVVSLEDEGQNSPRMRATTPAAGNSKFDLVVGSTLEQLDPESGLLLGSNQTADPSEHTLAMNLNSPRAHLFDEQWTVTYEGALPGFDGRFATLQPDSTGLLTLSSDGARFCDRGVQSERAVIDALVADGVSEADAAGRAAALADYVQLTTSSPIQSDSYWNNQNVCTYNACQQGYGTPTNPRIDRDYRIVEANLGRLTLESRQPPAATTPELSCCFPGVAEFRVRAGSQWIVRGSRLGFLHHMKTAENGTCRPSCDPNLALLTSRAVETNASAPIGDSDPGAFRNPMVRFGISAGASRRDMVFQFSTQGSFVPQSIRVAPNENDLQPTGIEFLQSTGELVVSDGSLEGLLFVNLDALSTTRQYN